MTNYIATGVQNKSGFFVHKSIQNPMAIGRGHVVTEFLHTVLFTPVCRTGHAENMSIKSIIAVDEELIRF